MEKFEMYDLVEILDTGTGYVVGYHPINIDHVIVEFVDDPKHVGYHRDSASVPSNYREIASGRFYVMPPNFVRKIKRVTPLAEADEEYLFPDISTL